MNAYEQIEKQLRSKNRSIGFCLTSPTKDFFPSAIERLFGAHTVQNERHEKIAAPMNSIKECIRAYP